MKYISLLLFILLLCGCKQQELLNHLDQQQANDVLAVLQRHNINAEKKDQGKTGFSIFVEPTDFASAVDWLKIYNLPGKPDIQNIADVPCRCTRFISTSGKSKAIFCY